MFGPLPRAELIEDLSEDEYTHGADVLFPSKLGTSNFIQPQLNGVFPPRPDSGFAKMSVNVGIHQLFSAMDDVCKQQKLKAAVCFDHRVFLIHITERCHLYTVFELPSEADALASKTCAKCAAIHARGLYRDATLHPVLYDNEVTPRDDIRRMVCDRPDGVSCLVLPCEGTVEAAVLAQERLNNLLTTFRKVLPDESSAEKERESAAGIHKVKETEGEEEQELGQHAGDMLLNEQSKGASVEGAQKETNIEKGGENMKKRGRNNLKEQVSAKHHVFYLPLTVYDFKVQYDATAFEAQAKAYAYAAIRYIQGVLPSNNYSNGNDKSSNSNNNNSNNDNNNNISSNNTDSNNTSNNHNTFSHSVSSVVFSAVLEPDSHWSWSVYGWRLEAPMNLNITAKLEPAITESYDWAIFSPLVAALHRTMLERAEHMCAHIKAMGSAFKHSPQNPLFSYQHIYEVLCSIYSLDNTLIPPPSSPEHIEFRSSARNTIFYDKKEKRYIKVMNMQPEYLKENVKMYEELRLALQKLKDAGKRVPHLSKRWLISLRALLPDNSDINQYLAVEISEDCGVTGVDTYLQNDWRLAWLMVDCALTLCQAHGDKGHICHDDLRAPNIAINYDAAHPISEATTTISIIDFELINCISPRIRCGVNGMKADPHVTLHPIEHSRSHRRSMCTTMWQTAILILSTIYDSIEGARLSHLHTILATFPARPQHKSWTTNIRLLMRRIAIILLTLSISKPEHEPIRTGVPRRIQVLLGLVDDISKAVNDLLTQPDIEGYIDEHGLANLLPMPKHYMKGKEWSPKYMKYLDIDVVPTPIPASSSSSSSSSSSASLTPPTHSMNSNQSIGQRSDSVSPTRSRKRQKTQQSTEHSLTKAAKREDG